MNYVDDRPRVPCKWCSKPTPMTGTKLCDNCYELDVRIRLDTELTRRILTHYERVERNMRWKGGGVDKHKDRYWYECQVCGNYSCAHQEAASARAELARVKSQQTVLAEALQKIASGDFPGAAAFMLNGEYNAMITKLQRIASDALAIIPLQPIQQETDS